MSLRFNLKTEIYTIPLLVLAVLASFYFYFAFPAEVPVHWNTAGEIDAYAGKAVGAFMFPAIILGMYLLFLLLPRLDPKKERYVQFARVYHIFKFLFVFYFVLIYFLVSLATLGWPLEISVWVPVLIGTLFLIIGNYMGKLKMNWFVGIKTPWTLSSENVWNKTHRLGGKLFMLAGAVLFLMPIIDLEYKLAWFLFGVFSAVFVPFVYSYILFNQEKKQNHENN